MKPEMLGNLFSRFAVRVDSTQRPTCCEPCRRQYVSIDIEFRSFWLHGGDRKAEDQNPDRSFFPNQVRITAVGLSSVFRHESLHREPTTVLGFLPNRSDRVR